MSRLDGIISTIVDGTRPQSSYDGQTLIVMNHLSQMRMFGIRQGIELLPQQDNGRKQREQFIRSNWQHNQISLYLDRIWDLFLTTGEILFFYRPNKSGLYDIDFYHKGQFRAYYDAERRLSKLIIIYSYKQEKGAVGAMPDNRRWIRMSVTNERIMIERFGQQPKFNEDGVMSFARNADEYRNTLGRIPAVICKNLPKGKAQDGMSEFAPLAANIERHEEDLASMRSNLQLFGSPILVTTRLASEVTEAAGMGSRNLTQRNTAAMNEGWYNANTPSTRNSLARSQFGGLLEGLQLKKVVGGVDDNERFAFLTPDPISPDHARHIKEERESLHFALGGIDEIGISANATAYEMRVIYGKVATTARKKCEALYTYGLCEVFKQLILIEEMLFVKSFAYSENMEFQEAKALLNPPAVEEMAMNGKIPPTVIGMPPLGNAVIDWRWTGGVFEDSPQETQQRSIVARNLQELGVRSVEAMRVVFPDKTETEIQGMLSGGYPFRYLNAISGTANQLLSLQGMMGQMPDITNPNLPLSATMPIQPAIQQSLNAILRELNYADQPQPTLPGNDPFYTDDTYGRVRELIDAVEHPEHLPADLQQLLSAGSDGSAGQPAGPVPNVPANAIAASVSADGSRGVPIRDSNASRSGAGLTLGSNPGIPGDGSGRPYTDARTSYQQQSLANGQRATPQSSEFSIKLPGQGSTVEYPPNPSADTSASILKPPASVPKPGDLWRKLFPTFFGLADAATGRSKRKRNSSKGRGKK